MTVYATRDPETHKLVMYVDEGVHSSMTSFMRLPAKRNWPVHDFDVCEKCTLSVCDLAPWRVGCPGDTIPLDIDEMVAHYMVRDAVFVAKHGPHTAVYTGEELAPLSYTEVRDALVDLSHKMPDHFNEFAATLAFSDLTLHEDGGYLSYQKRIDSELLYYDESCGAYYEVCA